MRCHPPCRSPNLRNPGLRRRTRPFALRPGLRGGERVLGPLLAATVKARQWSPPRRLPPTMQRQARPTRRRSRQSTGVMQCQRVKAQSADPALVSRRSLVGLRPGRSGVAGSSRAFLSHLGCPYARCRCEWSWSDAWYLRPMLRPRPHAAPSSGCVHSLPLRGTADYLAAAKPSMASVIASGSNGFANTGPAACAPDPSPRRSPL
jgi:hypothetical protein